MNIDPEFSSVVRKAYLLKKSARALLAEADELLDSLGDLSTGDYVGDGLVLKVTPTVRFDAATAARNLTPDELEAISVSQPSATVARKVLDEERYKATQKTYGVTRKIEELEDDE